METEKFDFCFLSKKVEIESRLVFWLVLKSWNHLIFVNVSPTLVIDTSMERSSRVLQHGHPKIWFFFHKVKVAKVQKNSSVRRHISSCSRRICIYYFYLHHTLIRHYYVSYYPVVPGKKFLLSCFVNNFLLMRRWLGSLTWKMMKTDRKWISLDQSYCLNRWCLIVV